MKKALLTVMFLASICNLVFSQSIWIDPEKSSAFSVELLRPKFERDRFNNLANLAMFFFRASQAVGAGLAGRRTTLGTHACQR